MKPLQKDETNMLQIEEVFAERQDRHDSAEQRGETVADRRKETAAEGRGQHGAQLVGQDFPSPTVTLLTPQLIKFY